MFRQTPEKLYKKISAGIAKGNGKPGFSASSFAAAAMREYLAKHPEDGAQLKALVERNYKESKAADPIPEIIMTAFGDLFKPAANKREDDKRVVQAAAPKEKDTNPYRILIVGDGGVGKHAIMNGFVDDRFPDDHSPGSDREKDIVVDNQEINLRITALDELRRRTMNRVYKGYDAIVFVYDVTNAASFRNIHHWIAEYDRFGGENAKKMIVGNKLDLAHQRATDVADAQDYASQHKIPCLEVSAITAQNISKLFKVLGKEMMAARHEERASRQNRMNY